ncbi:UPF0161 protein At3g09310 [Prunus avium]|uniref:UPF0161 protein At3g09310 n=1 Tax=Prunus avium TaxID=42229 RepID=A0A6P5TEK0_PRUAV|nr:UPF0161 protein At3g09310 [Prunus avium]
MAVVVMLVNYHKPLAITVQSQSQNPSFNSRKINPNQSHAWRARRRPIINGLNGDTESDPNNPQDKEVDNLGVKAALCVLKFYKREISPLLLNSCRYVPTCSEYSMQAYKKYGFAKGSVLTAWRICRCNPLGGTGYDPPQWFDETSLPEEE